MNSKPHNGDGPQKTVYVVGFLFDRPTERVVLIKKRRPQWQEGKLNGLGGHRRIGETPIEAVRREFAEQTGLFIDKWYKFLLLNGEDYEVHFFKAFCKQQEILYARTATDEEIHLVELCSLDYELCILNLRYIIPMALDNELRISNIYCL